MAEQESVTSSSLRPIFEKFAKNKDVSLVYGEPIYVENKTILPVAKVRYNFGGGSGYETANLEKNKPKSGGEGAGGNFLIKPLGVYEISTKKTIYKPIVPLELLFMVPIVITAFEIILFSKKNRDIGTD